MVEFLAFRIDYRIERMKFNKIPLSKLWTFSNILSHHYWNMKETMRFGLYSQEMVNQDTYAWWHHKKRCSIDSSSLSQMLQVEQGVRFLWARLDWTKRTLDKVLYKKLFNFRDALIFCTLFWLNKGLELFFNLPNPINNETFKTYIGSNTPNLISPNLMNLSHNILYNSLTIHLANTQNQTLPNLINTFLVVVG